MLTRMLLSVVALASYASAQSSSSSTGTVSSTGINPNSTISSSSSMMNMSSSTGIMSSSGMMNSSSSGIMSSSGMMNSSSSSGIMSSSSMMNVSSSSTGMMNMSSSTGTSLPPMSSSTGMSNGTRPFCGGAGYDLSSIANMDLTLDDGVATWAVNPCGSVSADIGLCTGQMCRDDTLISTYEPSLVNWYAIPNGVNLEVQNGDPDGCTGPRESDINFICNATSLTPRLVQVIEDSTCHYRAVIHTAAACTRNSSYQPGIGDAFTSTVCGGGAYDLSSLNSADITGEFINWNWTVRVCGFVTEPKCASRQPVSICQHDAGDQVWNLANYATALPLYEINPNGLNMSMESGQSCGNGNRTTFITFDCDPLATTPVMTEASEYYECEYWFRIRTNAVCGAPFQIRPPSSSSSSTGMMSSSSSSSSMMPSSSSTGFTIPPPISSSSSSSSSEPSMDSSSSSSSEPTFPTDSSSSSSEDIFDPFSSTGEDLENPGLNGASSMSISCVAVAVSLMAVAMAL